MTIEGVVVRAEDGAPIAGARVILDHPPVTRSGGWQDKERSDRERLAGNTTVITNSSGEFFLTGVVGDFPNPTALLARANGFVPDYLSVGSEYKFGDRLSIKLIKAGAISGKVKNPAGEPIMNMPIRLILRQDDAYGRPDSMIVDVAETDDRGAYRIYGIEPGSYYVLAGNGLPFYLDGGGSNASRNATPDIDAFGYAFYPGISRLEEAAVISMAPGAELGGIDFTMAPRPLHHIQARLVDTRTGQPPVSPEIKIVEVNTLFGNDESMAEHRLIRFGLRGVYDGSKGVLNIRNLSPGTYSIIANTQDRIPGRAQEGEPTRSSGSATVVISDADVENLVIALQPFGSVSGKIRVEGQDSLAAEASGILPWSSVMLLPLLPGDKENYESGYANTDGSFELQDVPRGSYRVIVTNRETYVRAIRHNGVDVMGSSLTLDGAAVGPLDITLSTNGGQLSGTCANDRGMPAVSARIVLVPDENRHLADRLKLARTDDAGHYTFQQIAPGAYHAYCWEALAWNSWFDPRVLAQGEGKGGKIRISELGVESVDLSMIPTTAP
jgi:hypothetical protein